MPLKVMRASRPHLTSMVNSASKNARAGRPRHAPSLLQTQRMMAAVIMRPLSPNNRTQKTWTDGRKTADVVSAIIQPNDRLTALERLEIYNRQYWFRLIDCFYDDFPGVRAVVGANKFDRLTRAYLTAHPSQSFSLRNLGQFFIGFLQKHPELSAPHSDLALDTARLEWAQILAFDEAAHPPLTPEHLAGQQPGRLKLALQPHITLMELRYPVDDFIIAVKKGAAVRNDASNAVAEKATHKRTKKVHYPKRQNVLLAVHRLENTVYYKRLEPVAYRLLQELQKGASVHKACIAALHDASPDQDWPGLIRLWFETWTSMGWFCNRKQNI